MPKSVSVRWRASRNLHLTIIQLCFYPPFPHNAYRSAAGSLCTRSSPVLVQHWSRASTQHSPAPPHLRFPSQHMAWQAARPLVRNHPHIHSRWPQLHCWRHTCSTRTHCCSCLSAQGRDIAFCVFCLVYFSCAHSVELCLQISTVIW